MVIGHLPPGNRPNFKENQILSFTAKNNTALQISIFFKAKQRMFYLQNCQPLIRKAVVTPWLIDFAEIGSKCAQ